MLGFSAVSEFGVSEVPFTPAVRAPRLDFTLSARERPREGYGALWFGLQGVNVRPALVDFVWPRLEARRDAPSWLWSAPVVTVAAGFPLQPLASSAREQPREGRTFVQTGVQIAIVLHADQRYVCGPNRPWPYVASADAVYVCRPKGAVVYTARGPEAAYVAQPLRPLSGVAFLRPS